MYAYLQEIDVIVYADGDCGNTNDKMIDNDKQMCAGLKEGGKDACYGDGGGPLVATDPARNNSMSLIGIASAYGCGNPQHSGVSIYTEVSAFIDWLSQEMPDLNTCPAPPEGWIEQ